MKPIRTGFDSLQPGSRDRISERAVMIGARRINFDKLMPVKIPSDQHGGKMLLLFTGVLSGPDTDILIAWAAIVQGWKFIP
jgi:hypothetical protein